MDLEQLELQPPFLWLCYNLVDTITYTFQDVVIRCGSIACMSADGHMLLCLSINQSYCTKLLPLQTLCFILR